MTLPQSPMSLPLSPRTGGEAHTDAVQRLDAALDDQERLRQADDAARGTDRELAAHVELSAANERAAASASGAKTAVAVIQIRPGDTGPPVSLPGRPAPFRLRSGPG
jgi:D-serine deaminase-like pyridoxal phosphate-dependent protein